MQHHVEDQSQGNGQIPRGGRALKWEATEEYAVKQIQRLCPTVDVTDLANGDVHEDLLLIITFYRKEYQNIPLLEILYRPHFKNILYCGECKCTSLYTVNKALI